MTSFLPYKNGYFYVELRVWLFGGNPTTPLYFKALLDTGANGTSLPGSVKSLSPRKAQVTISREDQLYATTGATFVLGPSGFVSHKPLGAPKPKDCPVFWADVAVNGFNLVDMPPVFFHGDPTTHHAIIGRDILMSNGGLCFAPNGYQPHLCVEITY